jgi:hypothetical protein
MTQKYAFVSDISPLLPIEGRSNTMNFSSPNPLVLSAIMLICTKASDPQNLSRDTINIRLE